MAYFEIKGLRNDELTRLIPQEGIWIYRKLANGNLSISSNRSALSKKNTLLLKKK